MCINCLLKRYPHKQGSSFPKGSTFVPVRADPLSGKWQNKYVRVASLSWLNFALKFKYDFELKWYKFKQKSRTVLETIDLDLRIRSLVLVLASNWYPIPEDRTDTCKRNHAFKGLSLEYECFYSISYRCSDVKNTYIHHLSGHNYFYRTIGTWLPKQWTSNAVDLHQYIRLCRHISTFVNN